MEATKILSVIIPAYNMEEYLRYCLDSLTVSHELDSLDIIVINDGSKDSTSSIAEEYHDRYPDTFKVINKTNGNYGSCINAGLKEARGKYVKILDADDSFESANLEDFISFLKDNDADLVLSAFAVVGNDRKTRKIIRYDFGTGNTFPINDICNTHAFQNMQMHAVTYRLANLLDSGYRQTEGISYTDQQWIFIPMATVRSVAVFDRHIYRYLIGRAGQTVDPEIKQRHMIHTAVCAMDMVSAYEQKRDSFYGKPIQDYLLSRLIFMIKDVYVFYLSHYGRANSDTLKSFDRKLKNLSEEIYELIGQKDISSFAGFRYIDFWRRHQNMNRSILQMSSSIYMLLLKLKKKLRKEDGMSLGNQF